MRSAEVICLRFRVNECLGLFTPVEIQITRVLASQIYEWGIGEGSGVFARLMIRAITAAISSMIAVPATKTVTKAMSKAVLA